MQRVARLMRAARFGGVSRRNWIITTVRDRDARPAPDLVERNFTAWGLIACGWPTSVRHDGEGG